MFKVIRIKNFRRGLATNSSSTHSIIYRNEKDLFEDLNIFGNLYFDRHDTTVAATKEAKIKYIFHSIWRHEDIVSELARYYPEIKQYYPLAKGEYEKGLSPYDVDYHNSSPDFGMYSRECIVRNDGDEPKILDHNFSVDYLRHIIDSPELVIVGGSDEDGDCYEIMADHDKAPLISDANVMRANVSGNKNAITKNGNYYVAFGETEEYTRCGEEDYNEDGELKFRYCSGGRLRFMTEDGEPIPEHPELIDLRITNRCNHGCEFCFMDSKTREKQADITELTTFINQLKTQTEFSIGGGNILLFNGLEKLFKCLDKHGHIVNTTINVKDCDVIMKSRKLTRLFSDYVDGIGVSVFSPEDVKKFLEFEKTFSNIGTWKDDSGRNRKFMVMHIVPEYLGFEKTKEILDTGDYRNFLFLGYKENGRGANCPHVVFTEDQIKELFKERFFVSIDTSFAKTYGKYIRKSYSTRFSITENEGEYSMYVDGITMNAYKSSYETDKPYFVGRDFNVRDWRKRRNGMSSEKAFAHIREDNGFPVYKAKHYWDEEK